MNRDYENLKRMDVGGCHTIEEPSSEDQAAEDDKKEDDSESAEEAAHLGQLSKKIEELQAGFSEQQAQVARLLKLQEGVVRATLSKRQAENLLAESDHQ